MQSFWQDFKDWAASPFSEDMPATHWFLLIGFAMICVILWALILRHITDAIKGA